MRTLALAILLLLTLIVAGCGGKASVAGKYRIEQDNQAFGEGAEKFELDLRDDGTYDLGAGPVTLFKGTWKEEGGKVVWSSGGDNVATTYRPDGNKLIPMKDDKDITFWRFVKK